MEEALRKLQEIGLEEVARVTHISYTRLDSIIHKRFGELDRTSTQGFIRILEREYGVDLSVWMAEYREFYDELHSDDPDEDKVFVAAKEERGGKSFVFWLLLLILAGGGGWYLFQNKDQVLQWVGLNQSDSAEQKNDVQSRSSMKQTSSSIQGMTFETSKVSTSESQKSSTGAMGASENLQSGTKETEQNETETIVGTQAAVLDSNTSVAPAETVASEKVEVLPEPSVKEVRIEPRTRMWVGIIHLDTRTKEDFTAEEAINIPLEGPLLLVTGHGDATLTVDDNSTYLNRQNPVRFHYDGERFRMVSVARFLELNQGNIW